MFFEAESFNQPLNWDVSNLEDGRSMFQNAQSFVGHGLRAWNVSKLKQYSGMFNGATNFNTNIACWGDRVQEDTSITAYVNWIESGPHPEDEEEEEEEGLTIEQFIANFRRGIFARTKVEKCMYKDFMFQKRSNVF